MLQVTNILSEKEIVANISIFIIETGGGGGGGGGGSLTSKAD